MNDTIKKLIENMEFANDFFTTVYDEAHEAKSVSFFQSHPRDLVDTLKDFIFHDDNFNELTDEMQNAVHACIHYISNRG